MPGTNKNHNAVAGPSKLATTSTNATRDRSKSFGHKLALDLKKVKSRGESSSGGQATGNMNGTVPFSAPLPGTAGTGRSTGTGLRIRAVPRMYTMLPDKHIIQARQRGRSKAISQRQKGVLFTQNPKAKQSASAAFDPPTPPESPQDTLPTAPATAGAGTNADTVGTAATRASRRPKLRLRYSSSESDADDDDSDSEEEVPWWTFTNLGMAKMRQRMAGERHGGSARRGEGKATTIAEAAAEAAELEADLQAQAEAGHARRRGSAGLIGVNGALGGGISGGESEGGKDGRSHSHSYTQYKHKMRDRFHRKASREEASPTPKPSRTPSRSASTTHLAHAPPVQSSSAPVAAARAAIPMLGPPIGQPSASNTSETDLPLPPISPETGRKRSKPSPIRSLSHFTSDHIFRRGSDRSDSHSQSHSDVDRERRHQDRARFPARRVFARSNSAPGSPMDVEELVESPAAGATPLSLPSQEGLAGPNELGVGGLGKDASSHSLPAITPHRQLSVESASSSTQPGRLHPGHVSDTEAHVSRRSRLKSRLSHMHSMAGTMSSEAEEEEGGHGSGSGAVTPRAGRRGSADAKGGSAPVKIRRMNTGQLKIRLPPPISQTLRDGWPHAGSWQDALREEKDRAGVDMDGYITPGKVREKGKRMGSSYRVRMEERRRSAPDSQGGAGGDIDEDGPGGVDEPDNAPRETDTDAPPAAYTPKTARRVGRRKTRRMRRYREALVPPTPNGLGFEPRNQDVSIGAGGSDGADGPQGQNLEAWKEGRPGAGEFSWSTPTAVPEGDELSRIDTSVSGAAKERYHQGSGSMQERSRGGGTMRSKKKKGWRVKRMATASRFRDPWQARLKRTMFLDARVTIYIRLLTIMVVTVALGT